MLGYHRNSVKKLSLRLRRYPLRITLECFVVLSMVEGYKMFIDCQSVNVMLYACHVRCLMARKTQVILLSDMIEPCSETCLANCGLRKTALCICLYIYGHSYIMLILLRAYGQGSRHEGNNWD